MQLTKILEKEILDSYNKWLHSYLNGDVKTYDSYFDDAYHFIGSTDNEEYLNRKDTTKFFKETAEQFAGKTELRNQTTTLELFGELIFITHVFDAWFLNGNDWTYYARFRFSSVLKEKKESWKFIYQHFSIADSKTDDGETIGFDKVNIENQELREAIKRRTFELEEKNRELEVEGALERIRAQAVAMKQSSDLLDIVVTMRNEFIKLGHEAHYFWHMMWLPEKYKKAMTSGDGTKIGFVMELPRHMHGDIPLLEKWEKSKKSTVVYPMDTETAIDYVDKMVNLGDFKNIDPQAPTHEDIKHIGGLTFIMARTTHGEIGYSLPGVVKNPPAEDLDILVQFAGAFDLAHRRFLDLQKAEEQTREVQIELALEKVRSRSMAMQSSEELADVSSVLFQQVKELGIEQWTCGFNIWETGDTEFKYFPGGPDGKMLPSCMVPLMEHPVFREFIESKKRGDDLMVYEKEGDIQKDHYKYMLSLPGIGDMLQGVLDQGIKFPDFQIDHIANFAYGNIVFITYQPVPEMHDIFKRFAKVFEQTYTRFLDLKKAEAQARESQIEAALEKVRSRSLAMHNSEELQEVITTVLQQLNRLDLAIDSASVILPAENKKNHTAWISSFDFEYSTGFNIPFGLNSLVSNDIDKSLHNGNASYSKLYSNEDKNAFYNELFKYSDFKSIPQERKDLLLNIDLYGMSIAVCENSGIITLSYLGKILNQEEIATLQRFAMVFEQAYTRFLDLQKAEAQTREAQIEAALEKVRSRTMAMQKGIELQDVVVLLYKELIALGVTNFATCGYAEINEETNRQATWVTSPGGDSLGLFHLPLTGDVHFDARYEAWKNQQPIFHQTIAGKERRKHLEYAITTFNSKEAEEMLLNQFPDPTVFYCFNFSHGYLHLVSGSQLTEEEEALLARFTRVFEQTYARFLDLEKAEAQTRTAQINLAVERVRAKALAMHKSEEIMEVVAKLKEEVMSLDIPDVIAATIFLNEGDDKVRMWDLSSLEKDNNGYQIPFDITFKLKKKDPNLYVKRVWENPKDYFLEVQEAKDFKRIVAWLRENNKEAIANEVEEYTESTKLERLHHAVKKLNNGKLVIDLLNTPSEEMETILTKMGAAFDLAYKRFEDLQKAEAQSRESQIEAALEKVRSRSLAMHKPDELQEVVAVVAEKLHDLGVIFDAGGVILCTYFPDNKDVVHWIAVDDFSTSGRYFVPYFDNPIFSEAWDSKTRGDAYFSKEFPVEVKNQFFKYAFEHSDYKHMPEEYKQHVLQAEKHNLSAAWSKNSSIIIASLSGAIPSESDAEILKRFAKVFEQAYIRFMDLQKAEDRARESQIDIALERVRSRTLAMQASEELAETSMVVFQQLVELGIAPNRLFIGIIKDKGTSLEAWATNEDGSKIAIQFTLQASKNKSIKKMITGWEQNKKSLVIDMKGKELQDYFQYLNTELNIPFIHGLEQKRRVQTLAYFSEGLIGMAAPDEQSEDSIRLLERFASVFNLTYTRFKDLKVAEAQSRESQIQLSLERIRAKAMSMHNSDGIDDVLTVLCSQFDDLGILPMSTNMTVFDFENNSFIFRETGKYGNRSFGKQTVALDAMDNWKETVKQWKVDNAIAVNELYFSKEQLPEVWEVFHESYASMPENYKITPDDYPDGIYHIAGKHPFGYLGINQTRPATEEEEQMVIKFANEFGRAYQRFLDLQKAEDQTKEARIEASLEKVRTVALSLTKSDDMLDIAQVLYEQLLALDFTDMRNAIIDIHNDDETFLDYDYSHDMSSAITKFSFYGDPVIEQQIKKVESSNDAFFEIELKGKQLDELIETRLRNGEKDDPRLRDIDLLTYNLYSFGNGAIGISNFGTLDDDKKKILKRFRNVFTFAYKRYTDLAHAEAQAREAKIESGLEKVRSVALSMTESTDLLHIATALYEQLVELGFRDIRNAIIDVNNEDDKTFLDYDYSEEMGGTITLMSYDDDPTLEEQLRVIAQTTDGASEMVLEGQQLQDLINMRRKNGEAEDPRLLKTDSVSYILYAFGNGAVGISNFGILSKDQKNILDRFRNVFTFAYQRFKDLQVKEEQSAKLLDEKLRLEKTLKDLQDTQKQLIQSEKMASLGELTAGIAHEIQNPLNFVNNFSEVSKELLDEMLEEIENGDLEEAKAIMADVIQNLEKINHHGKRADGIVKGMLQHSRASGDKKEPTNINALADEYFRLAYHGLRAKDKSFNATLETDYDDNIKTVNVISQDIGRVILNLFTNAFYAVEEKKTSAEAEDYKPTVSVMTKKSKNTIVISVKDNGNGIPKHVIDKIFQPFFTTKPTGKGTGLGLSMSYDIIKAHDGELQVETNEGEGTTFIIILPLNN